MAEIPFELVDNVLKAEDFIQLKMATGFIERPLHQVEKALNNGLFPRAMSQVPCLHEHLTNAARVKDPAALQRCKLDTRCLQRGL